MKVLLMGLDVSQRRRAFPNLALMKLSAYHKAKGDDVWLNFPLCQPDIVYASCVFTWNAKRKAELPEGTVIGGSGIDLAAELPLEVEHIMPDYNLYPHVNFSLGFTSRGCQRRCPWCIVPQKEGHIRAHTSIYEFLERRFKRIVLLDNNLLASPLWRHAFADLMNIDLEVDFNQGLDIRLIDDEEAWCLKQIKTRQLRFAFDDMAYEKAVREGIELLLKSGIRSRKLSFYVLVGYGNDDSAVERVNILNSYNVDIFPMAYRGPDGKEPLRKVYGTGVSEMFHGSRHNINKFLRLIGRLPT